MANELILSSTDDFKAAYEQVIELHSKVRPEPFRVLVRKGISPDAMIGEMPIPNPLLSQVTEEKEKPDKKMLARQLVPEALAMLRKAAKLALVKPTYEELEPFIKDDAPLLGEIFKAATGLEMFRQKAVDEEGSFRGERQKGSKG